MTKEKKLYSENSGFFLKSESSDNGKDRWLTLSFFCLIVLLACFVHQVSVAVRTADAFEKELFTGERNAKFRWVPTGSGHTVQRVTTETMTVVPVEVEVGGSITGVLFVISPQFKAFGIRIENPSYEVKQGIARARVIFNIASGMPLGRHDLVIQVFEKNGKTAIASGTIPFIILPNDMECLC